MPAGPAAARASCLLLVLPLSMALATPKSAAGAAAAKVQQSGKQALVEAFGHRSYILLVLGFFTCGFQLAFITVHLPPYLVDRGLSVSTGGWVLAAIGLFNIIGSLGVGYVQNIFPKRYILSLIYFTRALSILVFISFPITPATAILFGGTAAHLPSWLMVPLIFILSAFLAWYARRTQSYLFLLMGVIYSYIVLTYLVISAIDNGSGAWELLIMVYFPLSAIGAVLLFVNIKKILRINAH